MYEEITSVDNLLAAWGEFLRGKKKRRDMQQFSQALLHNVINLHDELVNGMYIHSCYEAFRITDPKPRNIHKATVRDRLLHHAMYRVLYPKCETSFIHDSYSCRDNKGTHRAFAQLVRYARKVSRNHTGPCWAIKMDIRRFFDSIDQDVLIGLLRKRIDDPRVVSLLGHIIHSFEVQPGKGMPLGNLTSQLFANVYMDPLDKFVKHRLKAKYYVRYADDFLILATDPDELMGYFVEINSYLKDALKLSLHPDKISVRKLAWGIDFVGYVALPHHELPRKRTVSRMLQNMGEPQNPRKVEARLNSYLGFLGHVTAGGVESQLKYKALELIGSGTTDPFVHIQDETGTFHGLGLSE